MRCAPSVALLLAACAGAPTAAPTAAQAPLPLALAGPRCSGEQCSCRPGDDDEAESGITKGRKRFELRTGHGLERYEMVLDGERWQRDSENVKPACAYFDLLPGRHTVQLRVSALPSAAGMAIDLRLREYGALALTFYQTLLFSCGAAEGCTTDELRALERTETDRCGSTKIEQFHWSANRQGSGVTELTLWFVLHVYQFFPTQPRGCNQEKL